jgi:hypothetical protein
MAAPTMTVRTMSPPLPGAAPLWLLIAASPAIVGLLPGPLMGKSASPPIMVGDLEAMAAPELNGTWSYASGEAGRERIDVAIAEAIEGMEPIARRIARQKLEEQLAPASELEIDLRDDAISLHFGAMQLDDVALGTWVPWTHDGTHYHVHFSLTDDGKLVQRVRSSKSEVQRRFSPHDDRLVISFKLQDDRLPRDLSFWLAYQ